MKRKSLSPTCKYSLLLFSTGVGFFSWSSPIHAQTHNQPPSVIISQAEGMISDCEIGVKKSASHDGYLLQVRVPDSISLIELTPSISANRSFRIRMDDPASIIVPPKSDDSTANQGVITPTASGESENSVRSPMGVMSVVNRAGWRQNNRTEVHEVKSADGQQLASNQQSKSYNHKFKLNPFVVIPPKDATKLAHHSQQVAKPVSVEDIVNIEMEPLDDREAPTAAGSETKQLNSRQIFKAARY